MIDLREGGFYTTGTLKEALCREMQKLSANDNIPTADLESYVTFGEPASEKSDGRYCFCRDTGYGTDYHYSVKIGDFPALEKVTEDEFEIQYWVLADIIRQISLSGNTINPQASNGFWLRSLRAIAEEYAKMGTILSEENQDEISVDGKKKMCSAVELKAWAEEVVGRLSLFCPKDKLSRFVPYFSEFKRGGNGGTYCFIKNELYHFCFSEWGSITSHHITDELFEMKYWILYDIVFGYIHNYYSRDLNIPEGKSFREVLYEQSLELMRIIGENFAKRYEIYLSTVKR
jgi:hypothetical protein